MSQVSHPKRMTLTDFVRECNRTKKVDPFYGRLLALDPGETTGYAVFDAHRTKGIDWFEIDQVITQDASMTVNNLSVLFELIKPDRVVYESYNIYSWKSEQHIWSSVFTLQVIGCIWTLCEQRRIPYSFQSAQNAKGFWDDDRLHDFNLYQRGLKHGRDATRHAMHYLCFGGSK